jgi:histidinol-phosphatase
MRKDDLTDLMDFAVDLAQGAGEITLKHFRSNTLAIDRKKDGSFVTEADREAESYLRARIQERFPHDAILGEEEGEQQGTSGRQWILDPIDGTYSFVHGVPLYGVLIALEIEGDPCVGAVNIPATGDLVYAARGNGCFWNGKPARVSTTDLIKDALLLSTDFGTCDQYGFGAAAAELIRRAGTRRTWGDCYGHILVATGRAEVMLDPVMNVWDCAAILPIVEEAGGTFTDWSGASTIHGGNAISTNGALYEEVMEIVARESLSSPDRH